MSFDPRRSVTNVPLELYPSTVAFVRRGIGKGLTAAAICRAAGRYVGVCAWTPPAAVISATTAQLPDRNFRPLALIDDVLRRLVRHLLISLEPQHEVAVTVGLRKKISRIQMQLCLRYDSADTRVPAGK